MKPLEISQKQSSKRKEPYEVTSPKSSKRMRSTTPEEMRSKQIKQLKRKLNKYKAKCGEIMRELQALTGEQSSGDDDEDSQDGSAREEMQDSESNIDLSFLRSPRVCPMVHIRNRD